MDRAQIPAWKPQTNGFTMAWLNNGAGFRSPEDSERLTDCVATEIADALAIVLKRRM